MLKKIVQLNIFICLVIFIFFLIPLSVSAVDSRDYEVRMWNGFEVIGNFMAFDQGYNGGSSIAAGDLGDDGVPEIVVGSGRGVPPEVKIFRQDGSLVFSFYAYAPSYGQGINVAVCDLDGDGEKEIVTGTQFGGGPHVRVFDSYGNDLSDGGWFAYNKFFRGGVNVACGDWDADGRDEIVTGAGPSGGPHVKIFDSLGNVESEFFAFLPDQLSGVSVAMGQLDQDAAEEVIVAQFSSGDPRVRIFKQGINQWYKAGEWLAYVPEYQGGVSVSAGDFNNDEIEEVVTTVNGGGGPHVRFFDIKGRPQDEFFAYESDYRGGVRVAMIDINGGGDEIITIPSSRLIAGPVGQAKFIDVDITNQRLTAYEWGIPVKTFPISTGTWRFPTPIGQTRVMSKLLWHDYVWSYGVGHPDNYNLPNVKYNLRIFSHIYIHYAYWHNNFGYRMSHGCVNVNLENSEWIYNWADVGTAVETHY